MKSLLFFSFLAVSATAVPLSRGKPNILSNSNIQPTYVIDISQVPWHVSLEYFQMTLCGGAIISVGWVVTAAHCTDGLTAGSLQIRAGTSIRGSGGQVVDVGKIYQNPNYDPSTVDSDISALELISQLEIGNTVAPVNLPQPGDDWAEGTDVLVTGWGLTPGDGSAPPDYLLGADLKVVSRATCNQNYGAGTITERMLCAGSESGADSCGGADSGGPLVAGSTLVGVISWGIGCARPDYPGVYSHMGALRDFITQVAGI